MTNRKGPDFERVIADWLKATWSRYIDRKVKTGVRDKGDIANFYIHDHELVIECKNTRSIDVAEAVKEAQDEAAYNEDDEVVHVSCFDAALLKTSEKVCADCWLAHVGDCL